MIDVALTPVAIRPAEVSVVIDVLRATSTASQALAAGYRGVLCADSIKRARGLRAPGRLLAGEINALKPADFDQGNSPLEAGTRRGDELVLATTNGTPAVVAAARVAPSVLLACLLNLSAVVEELLERHLPGGRVQLVCAGTNRRVALEDVYVAGRLCALLPGERTDAARVAEAVARSYRTASCALRASAHGVTLDRAGMIDDLEFCCQESRLHVVPRVLDMRAGIAMVGLVDSDSPDSNPGLNA